MATYAGTEGSEMTFVYSRTFIDEAPISRVGLRRRAASQPPPTMRLETACEAMTEEEGLRGYVQSLGTSSFGRQEPTDKGADKGQEAVLLKAKTLSSLDAQVSCGSRGHPQLCKRPCIYFVAGKCTTGIQCNYCHMSHSDRPAKLDKQQRLKFNTMGLRDALLMVHKVLASNASENGFLVLAKDILDLVQAEAAKHDSFEDAQSEAMHRRLERVLVRMPFHQLALLAVSKAGSNEFAEDMNLCIEKLTDDLELRRMKVCA